MPNGLGYPRLLGDCLHDDGEHVAYLKHRDTTVSHPEDLAGSQVGTVDREGAWIPPPGMTFLIPRSSSR